MPKSGVEVEFEGCPLIMDRRQRQSCLMLWKHNRTLSKSGSITEVVDLMNDNSHPLIEYLEQHFHAYIYSWYIIHTIQILQKKKKKKSIYIKPTVSIMIPCNLGYI